jgi:predicted alpha/beta superfamily hydrolase
MPRRVSIASGRLDTLGTFDVPGLARRRVRIYFPPGEGKRPRPVLYLFDGQNVFGDDGSYSGGWHVHRAVDRMVAARRKIVPIVVGIDHGGPARIDELSPWSKLDSLLDWMAGTLLPAVHRVAPVVSGPYGAAIGGSSMGGLAALHAHHRRPDVFGGALCMSPSLWLKQRAIFGEVEKRSRPHPSRIYLDCGAREAGGRMLLLVASMAKMLGQRGYDDAHLMWRPDARGSHDERSWARRLPKALRFMYR